MKTRFKVLEQGSAGGLIQEYLSRCCFLEARTCSAKTVEEAIALEIACIGQCRSGPAPCDSSLSTIKGTISRCVQQNQPIPILCPWGSRKPHHTGVDVADLGGLRMIECLNVRVKAHYKPGIQVRMRIENIGGHYLFADTGEAGRQASKIYVSGLIKLIDALTLDCLTAVPESTLMTEEDHSTLAREIESVILEYIRQTDDDGVEHKGSLSSWQKLVELGWRGEIPVAQRDYYRHLYEKLYPGHPPEYYTEKLAGYLASSLARYILKASGVATEWGCDFITLNFCPAVPGAPLAMSSRAVHYRTVPEKVAKTHIPPWRAQGYIKIEGGSPCLKIASWNEKLPLEPCTVQVENDGVNAELLAPFLMVP